MKQEASQITVFFTYIFIYFTILLLDLISNTPTDTHSSAWLGGYFLEDRFLYD